ncbi:hypothetical protein ROZALSC1DRAFT_29800 [Rozella allomycis CSF55]|uniref:At4g15545-like C-terminal domain-containing protein n=1 Tax=Rozella allomycis (strain CSF55) TaxID=988480 RepID=A0A075AQ08_ROZAC|nr:hypothetical protein O9G_002555 [Rozella allomycis CSF55]RKP18528.1 hypothetical protein ROZALSC1DRAFT_29800 [Rozella allomycis CSF55]|eukprot:EPZ32203.1 hypothetical protein O9G_002555 [Rozella allomycis CSF55]
MSLESKLENQFEEIRKTFRQGLSLQDQELKQLQEELVKKDSRIEELQRMVMHLENELTRSHQKNEDLAKGLSKLTTFRQMIVETLDEEDIYEAKNRTKWYQEKVGKVNQEKDNYGNNSQTSSAPTKNLGSQTQAASSYFDLPSPNPIYQTKNSTNYKPQTTISPHNAVPIQTTPPAIDGREFFKAARSMLPYDKLLYSVKAYNNREQSKHTTLGLVHELIGNSHPELFKSFEALIK